MAASVVELADRLVAAFNARDIAGVLAIVDEAIEFDFGSKTLRGQQEVKQFVERQLYGVAYRATHGRRFHRGDELVAESHQELSYVESGDVAAVERLGVVYVARNGRLIRYAEHPDLTSAFAASSVTEDDEIRPG